LADQSAFLVVQPGDARHIVRSNLVGLPQPALEIVELLASELVTNAITHARSTPVLTIDYGLNRLRIEVEDSDPTTKIEVLQAEPSSEHGRGLAIVSTLSSAWGVEPRDNGKAVWFEVEF
jgi:anti-sigma regulatory factor (Ser/Thr protein kinase)